MDGCCSFPFIFITNWEKEQTFLLIFGSKFYPFTRLKENEYISPWTNYPSTWLILTKLGLDNCLISLRTQCSSRNVLKTFRFALETKIVIQQPSIQQRWKVAPIHLEWDWGLSQPSIGNLLWCNNTSYRTIIPNSSMERFDRVITFNALS